MVVKEEQERVRGLIADTVTLLCRNGLQYKSKFCINALIGITLDEEDVFLVDIRETIKNVDENSEADSAASEEMPAKSSSRKRKKHRKRSKSNESISKTEGAQHSESASERGSNNTPADLDNPENSSEPPLKRLVKLEDDDEDSGDLVFVKDEPADSDLSSSAFGNVSQLYQHQQSGDSNSLLDSLSQQGQLYGDVQPGSTSWGGDQNLPAAMPPPNMQAPAGATDSQSQSRRSAAPRSLVCPECGKQMATDISYKLHMNKHYGLFRFHCDLCPVGRGFHQKQHFHAHLATVHNMDEYKVKCPQCGKDFPRKDKMKEHMRGSCKGFQPLHQIGPLDKALEKQ